MACGDQHGGDPRGQAFSQRNMMRRVRSARVRVAEAQGAEHDPVGDQWDDERRLGGEFLVDACRCAPLCADGVVEAEARAQHRFRCSDDTGNGARKIVAADRAGRHQRAHIRAELPGAMGGRDAAQRARGDDMHEVEVRETRECAAGSSVDHALW